MITAPPRVRSVDDGTDLREIGKDFLEQGWEVFVDIVTSAPDEQKAITGREYDATISGITIREAGKPGKGAMFVITVPKGSYRITPPTGTQQSPGMF